MALALYRKYRPRTFAEVIGQEHVTEPLSQALRSGRLHHAYLFSGPRGCGKTSSARILARSLNCEQGPTPEPCGVCASCRSLMNDGAGSIDVIEIDAASHGGVDDARDLREKAFFAPASSRYKIYVIDEAHMVSPAGFNALLKLVEEPPEYVKFIFATTEPEKVLGTIRSRTHHYPFRLIPPATLRPYLQQLTEAEGVHVEPAVFPLVVRAGGGSARDSLSVLDQLIAGAGPDGVSYARAVALLGVTDVALLDEMCDALAAGDGAAAYRTIDRVAEAGHDPRRFASDLLERFRDLIILQQVPDAVSKGLIDGPADQLEGMSAQAGRLGPATLSRCADIVHNGLVEMRGTTAPRLLLELVTARMLLPGAEDSTGALLQRLERMERRFAQGGEPLAARDEPAPVSVSPVSGVPAEVAGPAAEPVSAGGGGKAAALAAARAAAGGRKSASSTGARRPAAPSSAPEPSAPEPSAPTSAAPEPSAPTSAAPAPSAPALAAPAPPVAPAPSAAAQPVPAPEAPAPIAPEPSEAVTASRPTAPPPGSAQAIAGPPGPPAETAESMLPSSEHDFDDEPPWDDEPEFEPAAEQTRPLPSARPAPDPEAERPTPDLAETSPHRAAAGPEAETSPQRPVPPPEAETSPQRPVPPPEAETSPQRPAPVQARSSEMAGLLPDAPEEPGAAAVADVPDQPAVEEVRSRWAEITAAVKKQPSGKAPGAMADNAVVRAIEGDTVVLLFQHQAHADRVGESAAMFVDALYEEHGYRWQIRCEVGGPGGATPPRAPARREAPPNSGRPPSRNENVRETARAQVSTAPRAASGAQQSQAAAARPPQARRQETESPSGGDDDWPEPAKPGGLTTAPAPVTPEAVVDDEEDWPEVHPVGVAAAAPQAAAPQAAAPQAAAPQAAASAALVPGAAAPEAPAPPPTTSDDYPGAGDGRQAQAGSIAVVPEPSTDDRRGEPAEAEPAEAAPAAPSGASGGFPAQPPAQAQGAGLAAARQAAGRPAAGSARSVPPATASPAASGAGAAAAARAAANATGRGGGGLAAARAAAARQPTGRPAAGAAAGATKAWTDGSPTEEAPYDPEFDGPPKAGFEGFDPGDEPLDDVIDEKTARESSEQQAMRLLQEVLGAEKIGES
ncbi:DNA polymerase III subunit gamma and tau [Actinoplanes sp. NPDC026619]|uniref:DNA polymerase III subunit gamma and tau n=1 Tax=Actinoplanes sp. NPDC026619 TaxID=3155798 RepID=UPI0033F6CA03